MKIETIRDSILNIYINEAILPEKKSYSPTILEKIEFFMIDNYP